MSFANKIDFFRLTYTSKCHAPFDSSLSKHSQSQNIRIFGAEIFGMCN